MPMLLGEVLPLTKIRNLQRLQNRALTIIKNGSHEDELSEISLTVKNPFRFDLSVMTYKILNKICLESLWDEFELRSAHSTCKKLQRFASPKTRN